MAAKGNLEYKYNGKQHIASVKITSNLRWHEGEWIEGTHGMYCMHGYMYLRLDHTPTDLQDGNVLEDVVHVREIAHGS